MRVVPRVATLGFTLVEVVETVACLALIVFVVVAGHALVHHLATLSR
jgi:hypothetical protein